ncbi:MAG: CBS domain-containing protein [Byssovorax sp.]
MSKAIPTIRKWMSTSPFAVERTETLEAAHRIMRREGIRHLPVLEGGKLAGLVSERDLHLIETLKDVDPNVVKVEDAMTSHPYFVAPDARIDVVVNEMAEHKYGAAVVMQNERVVGVFTTVDAMRAFTELLHGRLAS